MPHIFFVTGASGVGKTTLISNLEEKYGQKTDWTFLHFDSIGVPALDEMEKQYGSREKWQQEITKVWIQKMLAEHADKKVIVFEGQVSLDFIEEGFKEKNFSDYTTVLVDCSEATMHHRLGGERMQPELITPEMNNWRRLLREQAEHLKKPVIDTHELNQEQTVEAFEELVRKEGLSL